MFSLSAWAETKEQSMVWNNEIRIGWGDQLFESLAWHAPTHIITTLPAEVTQTYHENYRYHQHLWAEYQHSFSHWFSLGLKVDLSSVAWQDVTRNGKGEELRREGGHYFYNAVVLPTMRFTYFRLEWMSMYLSLGAGLGINGGSETDLKGNKTAFGWAADISLLGISFNYKRAFLAFDYGGLYSLKNTDQIYLLKSAMFRVSLGVRF